MTTRKKPTQKLKDVLARTAERDAIEAATEKLKARVKRLTTELASRLSDDSVSALYGTIAAQKRDVEQLRNQLAACLTITEAAPAPLQSGMYGWSIAYQKVLELRRAYDTLRERWNEREVLTAFISWLSTRSEEIKVGRQHTVYDIMEATRTFCEAYGFAKVRDSWADKIKPVTEKIAVQPEQVRRSYHLEQKL